MSPIAPRPSSQLAATCRAAASVLRDTIYSKRGFTAVGKSQLDAETARRLLAYDPETGVITWRESPRYGIAAGSAVGCLNVRGYIQITLLGHKYTGHRLAWLLHYGEWPHQVIDHINGDKADNRIQNLRDVPQSVNVKNRH